jgi:NAD(P)-dependent dehydrogenase (short-subunit alcohol dehydrogenase family)
LGKELVKSWDGKDVVTIGRNRSSDIVCDFNDPSETMGKVAYYNAKIEDDAKIGMVLCAATVGEYPSGLFDWDKVYAPYDLTLTYTVNVIAHLHLIRALYPAMLKSQYGRIVWLAGGGAAYGYPELFAYSLSKVAVVRAVENIAIELGDRIEDFSIIALAPGAMETAMLEKVRKAGGIVKTTTEIKEPVNFIDTFLQIGKKEAKSISGKFLHVRDDLSKIKENPNFGMLRRIE